MAIYYFDIVDSQPAIECSGIELPSIASARRSALQYAGALISELPPAFWDDDDWTMTVSDANHLTLFTITVLSHDAPAVG